jgi:hypothetical protein
MIPIIARTTEELLLLVPGTMREGALALGATHARAVFTVVVPSALPGIITGLVLAVARISGETAPLLFTALNNKFFTTKLTQPISSLTVQVYTYASSPYQDWHPGPGAPSCRYRPHVSLLARSPPETSKPQFPLELRRLGRRSTFVYIEFTGGLAPIKDEASLLLRPTALMPPRPSPRRTHANTESPRPRNRAGS